MQFSTVGPVFKMSLPFRMVANNVLSFEEVVMIKMSAFLSLFEI